LKRHRSRSADRYPRQGTCRDERAEPVGKTFQSAPKSNPASPEAFSKSNSYRHRKNK
jgi:hypothetical protein